MHFITRKKELIKDRKSLTRVSSVGSNNLGLTRKWTTEHQNCSPYLQHLQLKQRSRPFCQHPVSGDSIHYKGKWVFRVTGNKTMNNIQNVFPLFPPPIPPIQGFKPILVSKGTNIPLNSFTAWKASNLISPTTLERAKYKQLIKPRHHFVIKLY